MVKKIWSVLGAVTALVAGTFLYEGGKLLFWYRDKATGIPVLIAGMMVAVLFGYIIYEIFRKEGGNKTNIAEVRRQCMREEAAAILCGTSAAMGILLYRMRYNSLGSTLLFEGIAAGMMLVILFVWLMETKRQSMKEKRFRSRLLMQKESWEAAGLVRYDGTAFRLAVMYAETKSNGIKFWGVGAALLIVSVFLEAFAVDRSLGRYFVLLFSYVFILLLVRTKMSMQAARNVVAALDDGNQKSVLGFFQQHYADSERRIRSLTPEVQLYAVIALADIGAYEEALQLLRTISWKPKRTAYFLQYEWVCFEGLRDQEGCRQTIRQMEESMKLLSPKVQKLMQNSFLLFREFTEGNYATAIEAAKQETGTPRQQKLRQKLAEDAQNKIFG